MPPTSLIRFRYVSILNCCIFHTKNSMHGPDYIPAALYMTRRSSAALYRVSTVRLKEPSLLKSIFTSLRIPHVNAYCSDFKRATLYPRPTLGQDKIGITGRVACGRCLSSCPVNIGIVESIEKLLKSGFKDENIYVTLERHMKCGIGKCGHFHRRKQLRPMLI